MVYKKRCVILRCFASHLQNVKLSGFKTPLPVIFLITSILCGLAGTPEYGTPVWSIWKHWKGNLNSLKKKQSPVGTIKTHHFTDSTESLGPKPHSTNKKHQFHCACAAPAPQSGGTAVASTNSVSLCPGYISDVINIWRGLWKNHRVSARFPNMSLMLSRQQIDGNHEFPLRENRGEQKSSRECRYPKRHRPPKRTNDTKVLAAALLLASMYKCTAKVTWTEKKITNIFGDVNSIEEH